jgi:hypothetical protein
MPRNDLLVARLTVWEGDAPLERKYVLKYSKALQEAIDHVLLGTGWSYYIRIPRDTRGGRHKLEVNGIVKFALCI